VDADTRSLVRRRVSDERRRLAGAELDGDALLALDYALDMLEAKREAHPEAA
jgi:hypothetical protein